MSLRIKGLQQFKHSTILDAIYPTETSFAQHVDRKSRISVILKGTLKELACGQEIFAETGSLVYKPGDMPHINSFGPKETRIISVEFEDGFLEQNIEIEIDDWVWYRKPSHAFSALSFAQQLADVSSEDDLLETMIELSASRSTVTTISSPIPPWIRLVEERIQDEYGSTLQTKTLAHTIGVHPVYLARVFRRAHQCSLKTYIQRIRLHRALTQLNSSHKTLTDIAYDTGFSDQSHFNRVFKQNIHISPGQFRKWVNNF